MEATIAKKRKSVSYYNSIKVIRREWKHSMKRRCMLCLRVLPWEKLEIHEIDRRSQLPNKWWPENGCNGLLTCRQCHMERLDSMPHAEQLAYKLVQDPENFNLAAWLSQKPRGPEYVTMAEVMEHVRELI